MTNYSDVTFVIQGAITKDESNHYTLKTVKSIKEFYPEAKIIVSTWGNDRKIEMEVDEFIVNKDPGHIPTRNKYFLNYNRMVESTSSGIKSAKTKYVAKIRSDFWFKSRTDFLKYYCKKRGRILMCMSNSHYDLFPYFISDWFNFGTRDQMLELWEGAEYDVSKLDLRDIKYNLLNSPVIFCDCIDVLDHQFHSEQTLCFNLLRKRGLKGDQILSVVEFTLLDVFKSYRILSDNFSTISRYELGLISDKHAVEYSSKDTLIWDFFDKSNFTKATAYLLYRYFRVLLSIVKSRLIKYNDE